MDSISSSCSATPCHWDNTAIRKSYNAVQLSRITASSQESKDITIFTDEGDKVTISYDHETQASYANLKALAYRGDFAASENQAVAREMLTRIQGENFQFEDSRNLTIAVDGDLNKQELADIKKAIAGIDEIMTDLLHGGDISEAMADAAEIRDLETIAGLEANYRYEKTVVIEKYALKDSETYSKHGLSESPTLGRHRNRLKSFMKRIEKMTEIVEHSKVKPSKFFKPLEKLLTNLTKELKEDNPANKARKHVADLMGAELFKRIRQLADKNNFHVTPETV
jgi:hypothetical protein